MIDQPMIDEFLLGALGGVSKSQLIRTFKEDYNCTDWEIEKLMQLCNFRNPPKRINYKAFYEAEITKTGRRISYPFTQMYLYEDFLSPYECDHLCHLIDQNVRPSTVADPEDRCLTSEYRTSSSADLNYFDHALYSEVDKRVSALIGLDPFLGETMQAQRYNPGQYYKEHWDFFPPRTKEYKVYCEWMGQRTWTAMIYLNNVKEGGETWFKHLKLKLKPQKGMLVAWNNLYKNGIPNYKTMHEALPPISGDKYVITKWFRSYALI